MRWVVLDFGWNCGVGSFAGVDAPSAIAAARLGAESLIAENPDPGPDYCDTVQVVAADAEAAAREPEPRWFARAAMYEEADLQCCGGYGPNLHTGYCPRRKGGRTDGPIVD